MATAAIEAALANQPSTATPLRAVRYGRFARCGCAGFRHPSVSPRWRSSIVIKTSKATANNVGSPNVTWAVFSSQLIDFA
jgi:hypothetical protein